MSSTLISPAREGIDRASPAWLFPQLLSIDAPLVAALWLMLFAREYGAAFHFTEPILVAAAVWLIYVVDHLLDVHSGAIYSERHRFAGEHSRIFFIGVAVVISLATFLAALIPAEVRERGLVLAAVVLLYFAAVHYSAAWLRLLWPKEVVMGAVFAAGCSIPAWDEAKQAWAAILIFGVLCTLNCAALDLWEWQSSDRRLSVPHLATRFLGRHLVPISAVVTVVSALMVIDVRKEIFAATALSGILLIVVSYLRPRMRVETARLLADAALLTPILFVWR